MDSKGKSLSVTYNYFDKRTKSFSDVSTIGNNIDTRLTNNGDNKYHIHSVKLDAVLPLHVFRMETGLAFTGIGNNTELEIKKLKGNALITNTMQNDIFDYYENTVAAYVSMERNLTNSLFGKFGLRYENTHIKGYQRVNSERNSDTYCHLFPTINLSWNPSTACRFTIAYSMGITRPNFIDLNPYKYYTTTTDYVSGNASLRPTLAHNAELNYSFKGVYAVLYNSYNKDAIGYMTRFN